MKPITFENLRRLVGGGRKKKEKESSFKRSDSFKRISIRRSYLDRGKRKPQLPSAKLEVATQTVAEEEFLSIIQEEVKKVDSSVQVDKNELGATISPRTNVVMCNIKKHKEEPKPDTEHSVVAYNQWLKGIRKDDSGSSSSTSVIKGSERTIIYVPPSDEPALPPVIRQLSSSPVFRRKSPTRKRPSPILQRKESNDSAVEMFPWGDSTEVKKSPLVKKKTRHSPVPPPLLPIDSGTEEMCSLSISLGRIWMDAPQVMAPRSLEMPKQPASSAVPAHHSLDSALKDLREDPIVMNRLQKRSTPPVARTLSSTSNNTNSTGLFSSKDSGFSFSISAPKLSDFHANFAPSTKGFFRRKPRPKPVKLSVSRDGYFKRTSGALISETKRTSVRRKSSKKKTKTKCKTKSVVKTNSSDLYQVVVSRPAKSMRSLKLDPMIFVPPEKRKSVTSKPSFKLGMREIRNFNSFEASMYSSRNNSTDEGLYESLPGDYDYFSDDQPLSGRMSRISIRGDDGDDEDDDLLGDNLDVFSPLCEDEEDNGDSTTSSEEETERMSPYVPPGVSPVPRRRPVRRRSRSGGVARKKSITYVARPAVVVRAPSTLRRPAKKIGKGKKQTAVKGQEEYASSEC